MQEQPLQVTPKKCCRLLVMLLSSGQRNMRTRDALKSPPLVPTTCEIWGSHVTLQGSLRRLCLKPQLPRFVPLSLERSVNPDSQSHDLIYISYPVHILFFICSCLFIFARMFHLSNMFFKYFSFSLFITSSRVFPFLFLLSFFFSGFGCVTLW